MTVITSLNVDCHHPALVAHFWSPALVRLEGLSARRADIGQGEVPWVVMEDLEDNHPCVLKSLPIDGGE